MLDFNVQIVDLFLNINRRCLIRFVLLQMMNQLNIRLSINDRPKFRSIEELSKCSLNFVVLLQQIFHLFCCTCFNLSIELQEVLLQLYLHACIMAIELLFEIRVHLVDRLPLIVIHIFHFD